MADHAQSQEAVAFALMEKVASVERRGFIPSSLSDGWKAADRNWLLDTYAECLLAVTNPNGRMEDANRRT